MRRAWLAACLLACGAAAHAGTFSSGAAGTAGANFLKLGTGARAVAMAGAVSAAPRDATAAYWNPAGLAYVRGSGVSLMYASWLESVSYTDLAFAFKGDETTLGLDATMLDFGSIPESDVSGLPTGSYRPRALVTTMSLAGKGEIAGRGAALGASVKRIEFQIVSKATTFALDAGIQLQAAERLVLAFAVQNAAYSLAFGESDPLPLTYRLGSAWRPSEKWLFTLDAASARDADSVLNAGVENAFGGSRESRLAWRAGYSTRLKDVDGLAGPAFGIGWENGRMGFDYAFLPVGDLGTTHQASFSYRWGS